MGQTGKRAYIRSFLGFELIEKIAGLSFFFPFFRFLISLCAKAAGYRYITRENLLSFLFFPLTIIFLLLFLFLLATYFMYELCVITFFLQCRRQGLMTSVPFLVSGGFRRIQELFSKKRTGLKASFLTLLFVLLSNIPVILFLFLGLSQTKNIFRGLLRVETLQVLLMLYACFFLLFRKQKVFQRKKGNESNIFLNGLLLFVLEGVIYFVLLALFIAILSGIAEEEALPILLIRFFNRFHFLLCFLFLSVNTIYFEISMISRLEMDIHPIPIIVKSRRRTMFFSSLLTIILFLSAYGTFSFFRGIRVFFAEAFEDISITAHRGASLKAPENTLASIELAIAKMADYAEIDVRLTSDGVPVLFHDSTLLRIAGRKESIASLSFRELSEGEIGEAISKGLFGERIPSLQEVLKRFGGKIGFNIELKTGKDNELAKKVVKLVEKYHLEDSCVITSFFVGELKKVKEQNESIRTGRILSLIYGDFYLAEEADFFSIYHGFVTEKVVRELHEAGKEIHVWTVNTKADVKRMKSFFVDNIITDVPELTREYYYETETKNTVKEWIAFFLPQRKVR